MSAGRGCCSPLDLFSELFCEATSMHVFRNAVEHTLIHHEQYFIVLLYSTFLRLRRYHNGKQIIQLPSID